MGCPIDADITKQILNCGKQKKDKDDGELWPWICTRKKNHKGKHHAHGCGECCRVW